MSACAASCASSERPAAMSCGVRTRPAHSSASVSGSVSLRASPAARLSSQSRQLVWRSVTRHSSATPSTTPPPVGTATTPSTRALPCSESKSCASHPARLPAAPAGCRNGGSSSAATQQRRPSSRTGGVGGGGLGGGGGGGLGSASVCCQSTSRCGGETQTVWLARSEPTMPGTARSVPKRQRSVPGSPLKASIAMPATVTAVPPMTGPPVG